MAAASDEAPLVTVVIPNWNTGPLLRLCLASVRRFTRTPHRVLVVDNGSDDASRETAERAAGEGLIELITRDDAQNDGAGAHSAALDLGLARATTPYLMALDSDAWARREGWLEGFLRALRAGPAGADASHAGATKFPGGRAKTFFSRLRGGAPPPEATYIRPCHALYRTDLLREHGLSFRPHPAPDGTPQTTGEELHRRLVALGYAPAFMPHPQVESLVGHLFHATVVLNAEHFPRLRSRAKRRGERRIRRWLASREARHILEGTPIP